MDVRSDDDARRGARRLYLGVDAIDRLVLRLDLAAHVDRHVAQVANHAAHFRQVLLHLGLASVLRDPVNHRRPATARLSIIRPATVQLSIIRLVKGYSTAVNQMPRHSTAVNHTPRYSAAVNHTPRYRLQHGCQSDAPPQHGCQS